MSPRALSFVVLNGFLFGSTLIASRFSVGQFQPLTYIALRLLIASSGFMLIYAVRSDRRFPRDGQLWRRATLFGIFGTALNLVGIVSSLQYQSSGLTSILVATSPSVTALMAHFLLPLERLAPRQWVGVLLSLGGALMLTIAGENGLPDVPADPRGYLLAGMGILSGSAMTIYARRALQKFDSFQTASIRMFSAASVVLPLSLLLSGFDLSRVTGQGYGALLYAALIGTFGGFFVQIFIIQRFGIIASSMIPYVIPLVATIGGVLILGETLTPLMLLGIAIILTGIALVQQQNLAARSTSHAASSD